MSPGPDTSSNRRLRLAFQFADPGVSPTSGWVAGFYYLRNCLNALAALPDVVVPDVVALVPARSKEPLLFRGDSKPAWLRVVQVGPGQDAGALTAELVRSLDCDVVFPLTGLPSAAVPCASIGWIPDFQHDHFPQFFDPQELDNRRLYYAFLAGYCDRVVCSSSQVVADFRAAFPGVGDKAELLPFSVTLPPQPLAESPAPTLERLGLEGRVYAYAPNQFWVHKNHRTLFEAWRSVVTREPHALLVCSGLPVDYRAPGHYADLERFLKESGIEQRVVRLGALHRADQIQVMRGATLVIQPSLFEGWSTSVEEAKTLGKPLLLSDIPVHREQCESSALYFSACDASDLALKIVDYLRQLAPGYNSGREATALAANEMAVRSFGEALLGVAERAHGYRIAHRGCSASHELELSLTLSLRQRLSDVESDRAARADAIDTLTAQLAEVGADRARRLDAINTLTVQLAEVGADRAARLDTINTLTTQLAEVEADRAGRLEAIKTLTSQLAEVEADRAARLDAINTLTSQLAEVEADRAARLAAIDLLTSRLGELERDTAARGEAIVTLTARLTEMEAERAHPT